MAAIENKTQSSLHLRSNSLPSATHPLVSQFEEHLQRLRGSEDTSSLSSSSVCHKLNDMLDLHDYTDKLLQLPIEQVLAQECEIHLLTVTPYFFINKLKRIFVYK